MALAPIVGLDIGSQLMKAVELHVSSKEGISITAMAVAPTPPGAIQNGMLTDPQGMALAVKQMLKDGGIRAKRVIGCIAGQSSVVVRIIEVPRMTPAELAETMKWEVERHVPFAPTDVQMDYQPLPITDPNDQNPNMSVLLAVAQKDMVNYYVEMLFKAGLDPIAIDIEPLAAGRALLDIENGVPVVRKTAPVVMPEGDVATTEEVEPGTHETVAVVNIGSSNTDISIFEDGMLIFPRSLALAGESITKAISEGMGYQIDQAERIKIEHAQVLMDRVLDYAAGGGAYTQEQVEFPYGQPEESPESLRPIGLPDSGPLGRSVFDSSPVPKNPFDSGPVTPRSPFDSGPIGANRPPSDRISSGPLGRTSPFDVDATTEGIGQSGELDLERTQPIQRRTLDLARRGSPGGGAFDPTATGGPQTEADSLTSQVFDTISPVLSELATELRRSLDYYRSRAAGKNVDRILICGGTASLVGLDKYLDHELQVPVQVASPLTGLTVTTKNFDPRYLQTIAPLFTVAIGLAARQVVFQANPLPVMKKQKKLAAGAAPGGDGTVASKKPGFTLPDISGMFSKKPKPGAGGGTTLPPGT